MYHNHSDNHIEVPTEQFGVFRHGENYNAYVIVVKLCPWMFTPVVQARACISG